MTVPSIKMIKYQVQFEEEKDPFLAMMKRMKLRKNLGIIMLLVLMIVAMMKRMKLRKNQLKKLLYQSKKSWKKNQALINSYHQKL